MNKRNILQVIIFLCSVLFLMVGTSKILGHSDFVKTLKESPLVGRFVSWLSWVLPIGEILVAIAMLTARFQRIGLATASILMLVFTAYNIYLVKFAVGVPCSCGGILNKLSWEHHLYVNTVFTILTIVGWRISSRMNRVPPNLNLSAV